MTSPHEEFTRLRAALAQTPADARLLYACCSAGEECCIDEVVALLAQRLSAPPLNEAIRLNELALYAHNTELQRRGAAGLPRRHAENVADLDYRFARAELAALTQAASDFLQRHPSSVGAAILLAESLASSGSIANAESVFAQLRKIESGNTASVTSFDPAFHATLPEAAARAEGELPAVRVVLGPQQPADRAVFVSADIAYFDRYGWTLIESLAAQVRETPVLALHVMDMTAEEESAIVRRLAPHRRLIVSLTTEWTGLRDSERAAAARNYYHTVRLSRFSQCLAQHSEAAGWLLDIDSIFVGPPDALFTLLDGCDLALGLSPGRMEVRNKVLAGYVGVSPTPLGRDYLRRVAGYVGHFAREGRLAWGIDQVALYAVLMDRCRATPALRVSGVYAAVAGDAGRSGIIEAARA
jgi:hypothetical protein